MSVEFMPGAIAYHLHSYSAQTIRSTNSHWVGPLLARGVTATLGCVAEPYLDQTPDVGTFFARLLSGASLGEAAYAAQPSLSWQTTVVGDPLYRPFGKPPQVQHAELEQRRSPLIEWSHLRVVNLNLVTGLPVPELTKYLGKIPIAARSAVLQEKLGDLLLSQNQFAGSSEAYERALQFNPSPQQRVRVTLALGRALTLADQHEPAVAVYRQFLKDHTDFADPLAIYQRLIPLLKRLGRDEEAERFEREISRAQGGAVQSP
jgi:tetratricopeptide (TPR) repeat protein